MVEMPLVSIIIPVYNGSNYMREAIDSALAQTYKNIEIIVINDGSKDETEEIALSYGDKIRYFKKENGGVSSALNLGIKEMKGDYFSWLSHDDLYSPDKVEKQVEALSLSAQPMLVLCHENFIDKVGNEIVGYNSHFKKDNFVYDWQVGLKELISCGCFGGCSLLIPRQSLIDCGLFDEKMRYCQDMKMWTKLFLSELPIVQSSNKSVSGRVHSQQVTQISRNLFINEADKMCLDLFGEINKASSTDYNFVYEYAKYCAKYNLKKAFDFYFKQLKKNKSVGLINTIKLKTIYIYGSIRHIIRKIYFMLFRHMKTN